MSRATGIFTVIGGSEATIREAPDEVRLTHVSGTQRIEGSIDGRAGTLVMESVGDHSRPIVGKVWLLISPGTTALVTAHDRTRAADADPIPVGGDRRRLGHCATRPAWWAPAWPDVPAATLPGSVP